MMQVVKEKGSIAEVLRMLAEKGPGLGIDETDNFNDSNSMYPSTQQPPMYLGHLTALKVIEGTWGTLT